MNSILLFLSQDRLGKTRNEYTYRNSSYDGAQTNDAPVCCLMDQGMKSGKIIDQIMVIVTKEVAEQIVQDGKTTLERFTDMVREASKESGYKAPPIIIPITYSKSSEEDEGSRALRIYSEITRYLDAGGQEQNVFIDYTGGMRDTSFLMTAIIRYLQVAGINCEKIIYSNFNVHQIIDMDYIYDMFRKINAVNSFVTTGNAQELNQVFDSAGPEIKNIINALQNFSDKVIMCNAGDIDEAMGRLTEAVSVPIEDSSFEAGLFKTLVPIIKKKMYLESGKLEYPDLIRWCLDNRLIQQAATFYVEKMPVYYFQKKMIPDEINIGEVRQNRGTMASSAETQAFYTDLFDVVNEDKNIAEFRTSIGEICEKIQYIEKMSEVYCVVDSEVSNIVSRTKNKLIRGGFVRLKKMTEKRYRADGKKKETQVNVEIYGEKVNQKDIKAFINNSYNNKKWQHYFIYNDKKGYEKIKNSLVYTQKAEAIKKLDSGKFSFKSHPEISEKMKYYLAVKLLRNRMNHAAGGEETDDNAKRADENYAIGYLKSLGIPISDRPSTADAIQIIRTGLELDHVKE